MKPSMFFVVESDERRHSITLIVIGMTMHIVRGLLLCIATLLAFARPAFADGATDTVRTTNRDSLLRYDSAYRAFVLDSMKQEHDAQFRAAVQDGKEENIPAILALSIPILVIFMGMFIIWRRIESRKAIKLAMIEKGMDPGLDELPKDESTSKYGALRIGMLFAGFGFGVLVSGLVGIGMSLSDEAMSMAIIASSLLGGGIGLVLYHHVAAKLEAQERRD